MTLPFTRAAWRPLCSAAVLGARICGLRGRGAGDGRIR
ncbi:hypothetical protein, partial [Pseudomonas aeruginosa]